MKHTKNKPLTVDISDQPGKGVSITYVKGEEVPDEHAPKKAATTTKKKGGKNG